MSSIRVSVDGELDEYLEKLSRIGSLDRAAINRNIAEGLRTSTDERFDAEQGPDGTAWKRTIRGGKILTKTGNLRNSIHVQASADRAEVGTNTVYAATHQFGADRTIRAKNKPYLVFPGANGGLIRAKQVSIKIPARPFLGLSEQDKEEIKTIIEEAIQ